ncbi:MAG: hypothetical protein LH624_16360 [Cryobacterium sp.]|nr:hypothetical protein [Cryobacterium sp.]
MSGRRPRQTGWRSRPVAVPSENSTSPTSLAAPALGFGDDSLEAEFAAENRCLGDVARTDRWHLHRSGPGHDLLEHPAPGRVREIEQRLLVAFEHVDGDDLAAQHG